jgi:hypothetical protein
MIFAKPFRASKSTTTEMRISAVANVFMYIKKTPNNLDAFLQLGNLGLKCFPVPPHAMCVDRDRQRLSIEGVKLT